MVERGDQLVFGRGDIALQAQVDLFDEIRG